MIIIVLIALLTVAGFAGFDAATNAKNTVVGQILGALLCLMAAFTVVFILIMATLEG